MLRTTTTIAFSLLAASLAVACITEDNYPARAAKVICDKFEECGAGDALENCEEEFETATEQAIELCDDYKGGLAYRCLKAVEKQSCDDEETPEPCEKFNDACGIETEAIEGTNIEMYGFAQARIVED